MSCRSSPGRSIAHARRLLKNPRRRRCSAVLAQQRVDLRARFNHDVAPGTELIREGDPAADSTSCCRRGRGVEGRGVRADPGDPGTGEVFGEIALIRHSPATATVRAGRPTTVLFLAREYFERLLGALPEMRAFFETLTEERLRDAETVNQDLQVDDDERILI